MKHFATLLLLTGLSMFAIGCGGEAKIDAKPAEKPADATAPAEADAPAADPAK